jgi:anionic cell wall polymer biosynthesis LytR-Cps2A-Psr (LCP) family protein
MSDGQHGLGKRGRRTVAAVAVLLLVGLVVVLIRTGPDRTPTAGAVPPPSSAPIPTPGPPSPSPGVNVRGPLDLLIVGLDTRVSLPDWQPHADAVLIAHIDADLRGGYLYSLPRDLLVDVPAYPRAGFAGGRRKLTEAMSLGAKVPGEARPDPAQGFELLRQAVSGYTGIDRFDAAAALTFTGMARLVDAVGGIDLDVDMRVESQHRRPDGTMRTLRPGGGGYLGPQKVYPPGRQHLVGWEALDFARQRYLTGGDYTRQRHHRQVIEALIVKAGTEGLPADPQRLSALLAALGETLVVQTADSNGPLDFAFALRGLRPAGLTLVGLPGDSVGSGANYRGEQLTPVGRAFLDAAEAGRAAAYLAAHPELVTAGG